MWQILSNWSRRYLSDSEAVTMIAILLFSYATFQIMGNMLVPIMIGIIIAYILRSFIRVLYALHVPNWLALSIAFTLFVGALLFSLLWLLPLLRDELVNLFNALPGMVERGQKLLFDWQSQYPTLVSVAKLKQILAGWDSYISGIGQFMLTFSLISLGGLATFVMYFILIPLFVLFFLKDADKILSWLSGFLPNKRPFLQGVWDEINIKIGSYVTGKILEIIILGGVTVITFLLMGLPYAILLGVLVGVSAIIPYVGITLITIPVVLVGAFQWGISPHFIYFMLIYTIIIAVEANILVPVLFAGKMDLHPVVIILAILFFGHLWGFWGVFFAIPLATFANVLIKNWPRKATEL
jgi:putative permease